MIKEDAPDNAGSDSGAAEQENVKVDVEIGNDNTDSNGTDKGTNGGFRGLAQDVNIDKVRETLDNAGGHIVGVLVCAAILLVEGSVECGKGPDCSGLESLAVVCGVVDTVLCIAFLVLMKRAMLEDKIKFVLITANFVIWVFCAGMLTFKEDSPWSNVGNGFFGIWGGLFFSTAMIQSEVSQLQTAVTRFQDLGFEMGTLMICSIVVALAAISPCNHNCDGEAAYALVVGSISFLVGAIIILVKSRGVDNPGFMRGILIFLAVWWIAAVFVLTFIGPFTNPGNGYFASWVGTVAAILLVRPVL